MEIKTFLDIAKQKGQPIGSVARAYNRKFPDRKFRQSNFLSDDELSFFLGQPDIKKPDNPTISTKQKTDKPETVSEKQPIIYDIWPGDVSEKEKGKEAEKTVNYRQWAFDILMVAIVIGHAGLIWYDCNSLWNTPGMIGGGLAFLMVLGALIIATDRDKMETSQDALYFVFVVDCAAGFAHFAVFSEKSKMGEWPTGIFSVFICLCSFTALYLFRNSKNAW